MFTLPKSKKKLSSRQQINLKGVTDGILMLPNNEYRLVMEVSSLNFELKSEAEQDVLIDTYESFLNSLPTQVQIIVRIRELDISNYLAELQARHANEDEQIYKDQLVNYSEFVQNLVEDNKILSRKFYVVLPYKATDGDFGSAKERLMFNSEMVAKGFMRMGIQTRQLESLEVLDLFYSFYNPEQAKRQPISQGLAHLLSSSYIRKANDE